jgi:hypothetical protein
MKLNVHIERLTIDAAPGQQIDREHLAEAIRRELLNRVVTEGLPSHLGSSPMRPFASENSPPPRGVGSNIGGALYRSLNR